MSSSQTGSAVSPAESAKAEDVFEHTVEHTVERTVERTVDVVVVGGGPAGATAADDLARHGFSVVLMDRAGRTKPCGGAVPPELLREFDVPRSVLEAEIDSARMISPSERAADMPIESGFVGMVDRAHFDEWLRARAASNGAIRITGTYLSLENVDSEHVELSYRDGPKSTPGEVRTIRARYVIGADGARSRVGRARVPGVERMSSVFAYHEIVQTPEADTEVDPSRCDVVYDGRLSPDFYSWIFPHGKTISVGTGTARQGYPIRQAVSDLRRRSGLESAITVRTEGAPIPMKPLRRWDDGHRVVLAGDAAGVVAPASGEGIYYAMASARFVAEAVGEAIRKKEPARLSGARKRFMKAHGKVFFVLGILQRFWYHSDRRRERFVTLCEDKDIQALTWDAYLNKRLSRRDPLAHVRVFFKDMAHLLGLVSARRP